MIMEVKWKLVSVFWKLCLMMKRLQHRNKSLKLPLCVCVFTCCATSCYLALLWSQYDNSTAPERSVSFKLIQNKLRMSMENREEIGCELPNLDPFSEEALRFHHDNPKVKCQGLDWVECHNSVCQVKEEITKQYRDIVCIYKDIIYVHDRSHYYGAPMKMKGNEKYYLNKSDHVKVSCSGIDKNSLGLLATRWYGYKAGLRPVEATFPPGRGHSVNVLILGFDSASRNGFLRRMPISYKVLIEELHAVVLKGYQIVGDGTAETLFPLLSGRTELEHPDARKKFSTAFLDPKLFIFHQAKQDGYQTAYLEDMPAIGSFQLRFNGFSGAPADHYMRAFFLEEATRLATWWSGLKTDYCVGDTPQYKLMLNLARELMDKEGKKFCFNFIADITHDDFNMISNADEDLALYLRELKASGKLTDTLLIVMGDHGSRFSPLRETYQGKMEERLPLMSIVLPQRLLDERPTVLSALKANVDVLTTPFDIHTTLLDAMGLMRLANNFTVPGSNLPRGMSLFEYIPKSRTCGQAAVLPHWCVCSKWANVSHTDPQYTRSAMFLAQFINNFTAEQRSLCAERTLTSISWVQHYGTNEEVLRFRRGRDLEGFFFDYVTMAVAPKPQSEYYQAQIVMAPGRAVFEGTMRYIPKENRFTISETDISRVSAYGDEPKCVRDTHPHLNKYCYCINTGNSSTLSSQ